MMTRMEMMMKMREEEEEDEGTDEGADEFGSRERIMELKKQKSIKFDIFSN
jgi:hypothetical protein